MIPLTLDYLFQQFKTIGIKEEQTIIVHCSLSKMGWVVGGAEVVIQALINAVGKNGTLMMPTQTWKNLDPSRGVYDESLPLGRVGEDSLCCSNNKCENARANDSP